jgi:cytoskeletal protein RodZ
MKNLLQRAQKNDAEDEEELEEEQKQKEKREKKEKKDRRKKKEKELNERNGMLAVIIIVVVLGFFFFTRQSQPKNVAGVSTANVDVVKSEQVEEATAEFQSTLQKNFLEIQKRIENFNILDIVESAPQIDKVMKDVEAVRDLPNTVRQKLKESL